MKTLWGSKLFLLQSIVFSFLALSFILPNGNYSCIEQVCTLSIGNWHMHDALWHISLAKLGFETWPLLNPYMAGETLTGYNFLLDYVLHILINLGISPFFSFFKLLPLVATSLYIYSVASYISKVTSDSTKSNILAFFLYFGSSATYLATLYAGNTFHYAALRGFPVVSVINSTTMFLNLQYAFSLSIFLWIIIVQKRKESWIKYIILSLLFFLMFGFKFYGGVVSLVYVFFLKSLEYLRHRNLKSLLCLLPAIMGSYLGFLVFYGLSNAPGIPFTWSPFALTHLMIEDNLLFGNHNLTLARYYLYENLSGFSPRLFAIEGLSIALFIIINFGTRLLGLYYFLRCVIRREISYEQVAFGCVILLTILAPILFVQNGGWYNTMQFLYYGTWLAGLLTADYIFEIISGRNVASWLLLVIIVLLTVPNTIEQLRYISAKQDTITSDELAMLEVLKREDQGVVHVSEPIHKLGLVPSIAEKPTYYLDTDQLMVTHAKYVDRLAYIEKYGGGSMTTVPAKYYLIYKDDYGAEVAIQALTSPTQYQLIYDSAQIALYKRI